MDPRVPNFYFIYLLLLFYFIFLQKCEIHSVANSITAITAQGRAGTEDNGFVFINCLISGTGNAYLGRAWKDSSRVIFAHSYMGELINEKGWDNFGHPEYNKYGY